MSTIAIPTNLIQTAIRAKSPVAGISIPGHAPFRVLRSLLRDSLKGLKIISATYEPGDHARKLRVEAVGHKVRATRTYFPLDKQTASKLLDKWLKSERAKGSKSKRITKAKQSTAERQLQSLRAKLGKITFKPRNPAIASGIAVSEYKRDQFLRWHHEKQLRRSYRSKEEFQMAVLRGKLNAEMSNPGRHYDWQTHELEWGASRYERCGLNSEDRKFIKSQIAVLTEKVYGVIPSRISCFLPVPITGKREMTQAA